MPGDLLEILEDVVLKRILDHEFHLRCLQSGAETRPPPRRLLIAKYIGFEPARWFVPEPKKVETAADRPSLSSEAPAPIPVHSPK